MIANGQVFAGLVGHLVLTAIPGVAAVLVAIRYRVESLPLLIATALAASGLFAIGAFWAYYADPDLGKAWDVLGLTGAAGLGAWSLRTSGLHRPLLRELRAPLLLWVLGSFFVAYLGFLHGGIDSAVVTQASRFSWGSLPSDNDIPRFYAEWFAAHGHASDAPVYRPDWLASDRPPLQIGYVLSQQAFADNAQALHYTLLSLIAQALWIPAMWALLCAVRLPVATRSLTMFALIVSDVALVHGFFVWPKLLATSFLLAAAAIVFAPEWSRWRRDPRIAALLAALLALSMLAHGSSVFGVIPLAAIAAFRGLPSWRWLGVAAAVALAVYLPWTAYQTYGDPPGDRLVKWQLGGQTEVDDRGALEAIADGYAEEGLGGTIDDKADNFAEMTGILHWDDFEAGVSALGRGEFDNSLIAVRVPRFYSLLPLLGVFLIAPFAMYLGRAVGRRREADWSFALRCFAFVGVGCLAWCLLLFGTLPARATLHVGALAVPLLAIAGCVAGLRATYPRLAAAVVAVNVFIVLLAYTPSLTPPPGSAYSPLAALLALLSLAGVAAVLFRPLAGRPSADRRRAVQPAEPLSF